jgi:hypothetical protein
MTARAPNDLEGEWIALVLSFGCIVCRNAGRGATPGQYHHLREGQGKSERAPHMLGICLCPMDHTDGKFSVHRNRRMFELQNGSELELLAQTVAEVFRHLCSIRGIQFLAAPAAP